MDKVKELISSRRFWLLTVGALSAIGGAWASGSLEPAFVFDTIKLWALAIAGIGTLDKAWTSIK